MDRIPTLADRFGGLRGVCPPSVRDTWSSADRQAQEIPDPQKELMMKIRIAVIASAIVALMALALATRVAAQPSDDFVKNVKIALSRDVTVPTRSSSLRQRLAIHSVIHDQERSPLSVADG